jgi:hypothetical protein
MDSNSSLKELQGDFLAGSSNSMPLAGTIYWLIVGVASLYVTPNTVAYIVLLGSGMILPAGLMIDKLRRGGQPRPGDAKNPLLGMYIKSTAVVLVLWPFVIMAANVAKDPNLIVLGGAVLMALVWIPYGNLADDPVGMQHAIARPAACYLAYWLAPEPYTATAISAVVVVSYLYNFIFMKRPG